MIPSDKIGSGSPHPSPSQQESLIALNDAENEFPADDSNNPFYVPDEQEKGLGKCGYLTKEGGNIKNWKKRWFEIDIRENTLKYFVSNTNKKLKGRIALNGVTMCEHIDPNRPHCFKIEGKGRTYFLQAQNQEDMFSWLDALQVNGARLTLPDIEVSEEDRKRAEEELGFRFDDDTMSTTSTVSHQLDKSNFSVSKARFKPQRSGRNAFIMKFETDSESIPHQDENVELPEDIIYHSDDEGDFYKPKMIPTPNSKKNIVKAPEKPTNNARKGKGKKGSEQVDFVVKTKVLSPEVNEHIARSGENYLQEAFSNIAVIPKDEKVSSKEIDRQFRRAKMKERTEYDTPDEDGESDDLEKERLRREKEFADEFSGFVQMDNPMARLAGENPKRQSTYWFILDIFRIYPYSLGTYFLSAIMIFIACLFYFFADWFPRNLLFQQNNPDNFHSYQTVEGLIYFFRGLFIDQNRGAFSIVASLETAISESGTYLQNYYLNGGSKTSLFLNGYVGRVLQLSCYSAVLSSFITAGFCLAIIGVYLQYLGQSELIHQSRLYILLRTPGIILYFLTCQFQSIMFGTLKMWEWSVWNTLTFSIFLLVSYAFLQIFNNGLMTMAISIDIAFFISVVSGILIFTLPNFRTRHEPFKFTQDFSTIGRFTKLSVLVMLATSGPIILDFIFNTVKSSQDQAYALSLTAVNTPLALFLQYGFLFNGMALVLGARCAKRFRYREFAYLILKSIVNLLCVVIVYILLFIISNMHERSVNIVIGEFIEDAMERELFLSRLITYTKQMWYAGLISVPVILLNNLYQTYFFCFERYILLIGVTTGTTLLIGIPGLILTLFTFDTLEGWYYVQIAQNGISCIILMILLHCYILPKFQNEELKEKMRQIEGENNCLLDEEQSQNDESDIFDN